MNLAMVDKNVVDELFGSNGREAGPEFLKWIERGDGRLTSGGGNWDELRDHRKFRAWADIARNSGWLRLVPHKVVHDETERLKRNRACKSNDEHVIALARIGGARLLYTNDQALQDDFDNEKLVNDPRGKVYTTLVDPRFRRDKTFTNTHRGLLARKDLSGKPQVDS